MNMKEAYQNKLQAQLDEFSAEIVKLKAKAEKAQAGVQLEYYRQIEELRTMHESANSKLVKLKDARNDAWEELTAGIDNAWDTFGNSIQSLTSRRK